MKNKKTTLLFIAFVNLFSFQLLAQKINQPIQLEPLFEQYSKEYYALNPLEATQAGFNDYNDQMEITISTKSEIFKITNQHKQNRFDRI
jgi:hypothetical protein